MELEDECGTSSHSFNTNYPRMRRMKSQDLYKTQLGRLKTEYSIVKRMRMDFDGKGRCKYSGAIIRSIYFFLTWEMGKNRGGG